MRWQAPPRVLKRVLTRREETELRLYAEHNPFDDQSNFHVPPAQLAMIVKNMMGSTHSLKDFMLFREQVSDVDAQLLSGGW